MYDGGLITCILKNETFCITALTLLSHQMLPVQGGEVSVMTVPLEVNGGSQKQEAILTFSNCQQHFGIKIIC